MPKKQANFDIIVSGGGLVGLTYALAQAQADVKVLVLDAVPAKSLLEATYDGRASAVALASANMLGALGLTDLFAHAGEPIWDIRVVDGHVHFGVSPFFLHYNHRDLDRHAELSGKPFGYIVENVLLRRALSECARSHSNITILEPRSITETWVSGGRRWVILDDGSEYNGSLLVVAEGKNSRTRNMLGVSVYRKAYRQASIVCTVKHACGHAGTAVELFLPSGPFAILPMTGRRSNVVWTEDLLVADDFMALGEADFLDAVRLRFGDWLGSIDLVSSRFFYPLELLHARDYIGDRFALIGDSAHAIHPIAGQGVNLGFRDCAALAQSVIDGARLGLDMGGDEILRDYQTWRRFDNQLLIGVTDTLVGLFSNDNGVLRSVRGLGMAAVNRFTPLKRVLQKHAMGMLATSATDLPRLLRGELL